MDKLEELEKLAKPFHDYLERNWHPHAAVIITTEGVTVVEDAIGIPFNKE